MEKDAGVGGIGKNPFEIGIVGMRGQFELERLVEIVGSGRAGRLVAWITRHPQRRNVGQTGRAGIGVAWNIVRRNHPKALTDEFGQGKSELYPPARLRELAMGRQEFLRQLPESRCTTG